MHKENFLVVWQNEIQLENVLFVAKRERLVASNGLETHRHDDCMEISFLYKGRQTYRVNYEEIYELNGGDVFITYPNELHDTAELPEEKSTLFWMNIRLFNPEKECHSFLGLPKEESLALVKRLLSLPKRHFKGNHIIKECFDKILDSRQENSTLHKTMMQTLFLYMIFEIIKQSEAYGINEISEDIQTTVRYIDNNIYENIPVSKLADIVHLSESHFKHKFKAQIGIPPKDYILRKRIDISKKMLLNGASLLYIAMNLNFGSSQYFCSVFKRYTLETPMEFKKRIQSDGKFKKTVPIVAV